MRWYQVVVSLSPNEAEITIPAGSHLPKAIDIGQNYLREQGGIESRFEVQTIPDGKNQVSEQVYVSHNDSSFYDLYRLDRCEKAIRGELISAQKFDLPAFLKKQAH